MGVPTLFCSVACCAVEAAGYRVEGIINVLQLTECGESHSQCAERCGLGNLPKAITCTNGATEMLMLRSPFHLFSSSEYTQQKGLCSCQNKSDVQHAKATHVHPCITAHEESQSLKACDHAQWVCSSEQGEGVREVSGTAGR